MDQDSSCWERLEELFAAAVEVPLERRDVFIERETGSDPELQRRLRALLDHDTGAIRESRLDGPLDRLCVGGARFPAAGQ